MRGSLRSRFRWALAAMVAGAILLAAVAGIENDFFQFCTTKAYGWPAPWRIDYCLCEGERTDFPAWAKLANGGLVLASGLFGFMIPPVLARRRSRKINT